MTKVGINQKEKRKVSGPFWTSILQQFYAKAVDAAHQRRKMGNAIDKDINLSIVLH